MSECLILNLISRLTSSCHRLRQIIQKQAHRLIRFLYKQLERRNSKIEKFSKESILDVLTLLLESLKCHP
jgi:hypothetical protein